MPEALLSIRGLRKRFGGIIASDGIDIDVESGHLHAVIGPNGAGKTTLVSQLAGEIRPDHGTVLFAGQDITRFPAHLRSRSGLARSFQITSVVRQITALENVALAVQAHAGHSFRFWAPAWNDARLCDPSRAILEEVGLGGRVDVLASDLAHGEKRALEIAIAMATRPRLLLLDEPMAGMGVADSARMIQLLARLKGKVTILLIEHDMEAVFALADRLSVLVYGRVIATGSPDEIRGNAEVQEAYLGEGGNA